MTINHTSTSLDDNKALATYEGLSEVDSSTCDQSMPDNSNQEGINKASDETTKEEVETASLRRISRQKLCIAIYMIPKSGKSVDIREGKQGKGKASNWLQIASFCCCYGQRINICK